MWLECRVQINTFLAHLSIQSSLALAQSSSHEHQLPVIHYYITDLTIGYGVTWLGGSAGLAQACSR